MLGTAGTAFARPPYEDVQGRRQAENIDRAEIRRSMGRPGGEPPPDASRERRRMSEAERQSLRQSVREAYGDPRNRPRR